MKKMYKFLLCLCLGWLANTQIVFAQAGILHQKVSITKKAASLDEILKELSANYKVNFSYSKDLVSLHQKVTVNASQLPLKDVLDILFIDARIQYLLIGNQIVLQKNKRKKSAPVLTGYITDAATGESLAGATVTNGGTETISNNYGFYTIAQPSGAIKLEVKYLGYDLKVILVPALSRDTLISVQLHSTVNELVEVSVSSETTTGLQQMNKISMTSSELKQLPRLMGEADAIKAFQMMPGVLAGKEGSSDLIVRGGSPDQNLILLDGVPVYNVSHLLGIFSVFNPDAIRKVDLIKGGFPAPYGGRLSSVVDIRLKEGNTQRFAGEGSVGLISSKLLLEGPIKNEKTSFLISARRTYLDLVTAVLGANNNSYNFHDLNVKVNRTLSSKDRIYLSVYGGLDKFVFRDKPDREQKFKMKWGNTTGSLRWNHVYGRKLFSNVTLTHSAYRFGQNSEVNSTKNGSNIDREVNFNSSINDWGAKADFDLAAGSIHTMRFGGSYIYHTFNPESVTFKAGDLNFTTSSFAKTKAQEIYMYAEDRILITQDLEAIAGAHWSAFAVKGRNYTSLQPRLALSYMPNIGFSLRTSYSTMAQYLHLLSNTSTGSPTDVWAPATDKVKPQRSWQATAGAAASVIGDLFELSVDLYYKKLRDVAEFKDGGDFVGQFLRNGPDTKFASLIAAPYEERITNGIGWSYGSEWMLRKREGYTTGWLGYTLSYARRQLEGINNNKPYPYSYDSRHSIAMVVNHKLSKKLSVG
ncbi:MAG: TonB-dependent receptor [Daejeonella sp.]